MLDKHLCLVALCVASTSHAYATSNQADIEIIVDAKANTSVVSPSLVSRSVSAEEIKESGKNTINEVFKDLLNLRMVGDSVGTGVLGFPDVGGYGETAYANTLILLNGRKLNNPTQEKPNISNIPISAISRIDVFPGGSGVLFGSGAVGGVINIITYSTLDAPRTVINSRVGSFGYVSSGISLTSPLSDQNQFSAVIESTSKDGYRHHTDYDNNFGQISIGRSANKSSWLVSYSHGLQERKDSGAALESTIKQNRLTEGTATVLDIRQENISFDGSLDSGSAQYGVHLAYRSSEHSGTYTTNAYGRQQQTEINSLSITRSNYSDTNILGIDLSYGSYYAPFYQITSYQDAAEVFWRNKSDFGGKTSLLSGIRLAHVKDEMSSSSQKEKTLGAAEINLMHSLSNIDLSIRADRAFRYANMDDNRTTILKPQISDTLTLSASNGSLSSRLFTSKISDEIIYDSVQSANVNIPDTSRQGMEVLYQMSFNSNLTLDGSYSHTVAKIKSGSYDGYKVPDVPQNVGNVTFTWKANDRNTTRFETYYVSSKYAVSDYSNSLDKSEAYYVSNLSHSYKLDQLTTSLTVNNLFNEDYNYYEIFHYTGNKYVTPAEPTAVNFQISYTF